MEGGREDGKEGRRTRRRRSGYRTKNKNPTRQCGEKWGQNGRKDDICVFLF